MCVGRMKNRKTVSLHARTESYKTHTDDADEESVEMGMEVVEQEQEHNATQRPHPNQNKW